MADRLLSYYIKKNNLACGGGWTERGVCGVEGGESGRGDPSLSNGSFTAREILYHITYDI